MECSWCLSPEEGMWKTDIIKYQNTLTILSRESTAYTNETQVLSQVLPQKQQQRKANDIIFPLQLQVPLTQFEVHANLMLQSFLKNKKFWHPQISSHSWWRWVSNRKTSKVGRQRNGFYNVTWGRHIWAAEGTPPPFVGQKENRNIKDKCSDVESSQAELGFYTQRPGKGTQTISHLQHTSSSGPVEWEWGVVPGVNNSEPYIREPSGWKKREKEILLLMHIISKQSKMHHKDPTEILGKGILKILTHKRYIKLEFIVLIVCPFWIISS